MKFSRQISAADESSLPKIERYFRQRGVVLSKSETEMRAEPFRWSHLLTAKDPERLSWNSLRLVHEESGVRIQFGYNWSLQAVAHVLLSWFVFVMVIRYGDPVMLTPMLVTTNAIFFVGSVLFALHYANTMTKELAGLTAGSAEVSAVA